MRHVKVENLVKVSPEYIPIAKQRGLHHQRNSFHSFKMTSRPILSPYVCSYTTACYSMLMLSVLQKNSADLNTSATCTPKGCYLQTVCLTQIGTKELCSHSHKSDSWPWYWWASQVRGFPGMGVACGFVGVSHCVGYEIMLDVMFGLKWVYCSLGLGQLGSLPPSSSTSLHIRLRMFI